MFKKALALITVLSLALVMAACGTGSGNAPAANSAPADANASAPVQSQQPAASGEPFLLGVFEPLSGGSAAYGNEALNAIKLGAKVVNAAGGLNGQMIEVVAYDTQSSPEEAVKVVNKMIEDDKVDAIIGSLTSSEMLSAGPFCNDAGIYTLGLGTAATWMKEDWPFVFRPTMNNALGAGMVVDMFEDLKYTKVAILTGQDDSSISTANSVRDICAERGIEVSAFERYEQGDTDFTGQITTILSTKPQGIFTAILGDVGGTVVKQLRQNGYTGLIFDKESFSPAKAQVAGDAATYIAFPSPYVVYTDINDCDIPNVKEFIQLYTNEYGGINETDSAYRGWDAMLVLTEAARIAGTNDSEALRQATQKISIQGLGGTLDYSSGAREGYESFNKFILVDGTNILWDEWLSGGGYEAYRQATGNES